MKKSLKLISLSLLFSLNVWADCIVISSPATNIKDVRGVDGRAQSISKVYYDKNQKMQIKSYSTAYIDFFNDTIENVKDDCKKYNITMIYNFKIDTIIDENYYHFNATYDFN